MAQLIANYDRSWVNCPIVSNLCKDRPIVLAEYIVRRDRRIKSERYARGHVCEKRSREWSSHSYQAPFNLRLAAVYGMPERQGTMRSRTHARMHSRTLSCHPSAAAHVITIVDRREDALARHRSRDGRYRVLFFVLFCAARRVDPPRSRDTRHVHYFQEPRARDCSHSSALRIQKRVHQATCSLWINIDCVI